MGSRSPALGLWRYRGVSLELNPALIHRGRRYPVPWYAGEGWGHVRLKVAVVTHLLAWGYPWRKIHWKQRPRGAPRGTRPDIIADSHGDLPAFWFECGGVESEKLRRISQKLPDFQPVHVMEMDWFGDRWNAEDRLSARIKDARTRRRAILRYRERNSVPGVEYWAIHEGSKSARIIYAVRRERNGKFTYLDSGEGWSLSGIQFVSRKKDGFQPLIPGIVGHKKCKGQDPSLM